MITANASTEVDDLGVATSGGAAIERALENDAPGSAAPCVISPNGIPGDAAAEGGGAARSGETWMRRLGSCYDKSGGAAEGSVFSLVVMVKYRGLGLGELV
jgi:hypothetical protein